VGLDGPLDLRHHRPMPVLQHPLEPIDARRWPASRRRLAAVLACAGAIAAGSGYLIGQAGGPDRDAAERAGTEAGETAGRAAGLERGHEVGLTEGEVAGYAAGYRSAHESARTGAPSR
jgi:hypothetical protein